MIIFVHINSSIYIPESITYTFLTDLWIVNNLWALIVPIFFCMKYGFKIYIPFFVAGLFFLTMYMFYNDSAMIYIISYFILSFFGSLIAGHINKRKNINPSLWRCFIMDKRKKIKVITTIICLLLSIFALYTFIFIAEVSKGWRIVLIIIAIFWIISGISNLLEYFGKQK